MVGHRWQRPQGWRLEVAAGLWVLHTDPSGSDPSFLDPSLSDPTAPEGSSQSEHLRLQLAALFPLTTYLAGHPLELGAGLVHTEIDDRVSESLATGRITEASLSLLARVGDGSLPVDAVGLAIRYFDAESFDGWVVGITVSD